MRLANVAKGDVNIIQGMVSELGTVAQAFYSETSRMCTVLVTLLHEETFNTDSDRAVAKWAPTTSPDKSAVEDIIKPFSKENKLEQCVATVTTTAGYHFRSIAVATLAFVVGFQPTVKAILKVVYKRVNASSENAFGDLKTYM
jgi:hypothetical protein